MNELARMENMSSEETNDTSELTFRTAALKVILYQCGQVEVYCCTAGSYGV